MCLSCICLLALQTLICVTFSFPPGVGGCLRLLLVALPGLFCLPLRKIILPVTEMFINFKLYKIKTDRLMVLEVPDSVE